MPATTLRDSAVNKRKGERATERSGLATAQSSRTEQSRTIHFPEQQIKTGFSFDHNQVNWAEKETSPAVDNVS